MQFMKDMLLKVGLVLVSVSFLTILLIFITIRCLTNGGIEEEAENDEIPGNTENTNGERPKSSDERASSTSITCSLSSSIRTDNFVENIDEIEPENEVIKQTSVSSFQVLLDNINKSNRRVELTDSALSLAKAAEKTEQKRTLMNRERQIHPKKIRRISLVDLSKKYWKTSERNTSLENL